MPRPPRSPRSLRTAAVVSAALLFVCAFANALLRAPPAQADSRELVSPSVRGARHHFAPSSPEDGRALMDDGLARGLLDGVADVARAQGAAPPIPDPRLVGLAEVLARAMKGSELPGLELQEFLLSHFGLGELPPHFITLQVGASDAAIRERIERQLPGAIKPGIPVRVGVGVHRRWWKTSIVVALQTFEVEMLPVPRRLELGASTLLGGRLLGELRDPRLLVTLPGGHVQALPVRLNQTSFQTSFRCEAGAGKYQVEVTGTGRAGKTLVANFPIYCGVDPPSSFPRSMVAQGGRLDPRREEVRLAVLVNEARVAAGQPRLVWDEALAGVARAYSEEMAEKRAVHHLSSVTGHAGDRVRRAGVNAVIVLENVARAPSAEDAHRSFMSSPAHRANVLRGGPARLGIGVFVKEQPTGGPLLYVTQLFAR